MLIIVTIAHDGMRLDLTLYKFIAKPKILRSRPKIIASLSILRR